MRQDDREEIFRKFKEFTDLLGKRRTEGLEEIIDPEISAHFSITNKLKDGSQASVYGIRDFLESFPETDHFVTDVYRYTCLPEKKRMDAYGKSEDYVSQYAQLMCFAEKEKKSFGFVIQFLGEWKHFQDGWKLAKLKMDIVKGTGDLAEEFEKDWIFPQGSALIKDRAQLPCIRGDFDSPWLLAEENDRTETEEDAVLDTINRFLFGVDHFKFEYCYDTTDEKFVAEDVFDIAGKEERNGWIPRLKYKRQAVRYSVHPCLCTGIQVAENEADVKVSFMKFKDPEEEGNGQKELEISTESSLVKLQKSDTWKIVSWNKEKAGE